uniref:CUB domain-containing protein n=1 Tax=Clastoptera arizonana TaxID=38151 RepID=A0A1B6DJS0_9HEMI
MLSTDFVTLVLWIILSPVAANNLTEQDVISKSSCRSIFNSTSFYIKSPTKHNKGKQCEYIIMPASNAVCSIQVTFQDFQLPSKDGCTLDYLEISGNTFCGEISGSTIIPFQKPTLLIRFKNFYGGGRGFNIKIDQQECSKSKEVVFDGLVCNAVFNNPKIEIMSPGYPNPYPSNTNCSYVIKRVNNSICEFLVKFYYSALEESENCIKDKLVIGDDVLCGDVNDSRRYFTKHDLNIRFITDSENNYKGFRLIVEQYQCAYNTHKAYEKQDIENIPRIISSSQFPEQYPGQILSTFRFSGGHYLDKILPESQFTEQYPGQIISSQFPVQQNPDQVYPPPQFPGEQYSNQVLPSSQFPVLQQIPNIFQPPTSYQCCTQIYNEKHFLLVSPNFPKSQVSNCLYTIKKYSPYTYQLRFNFIYFWISTQNSNNPYCTDFLEIDNKQFCGCKTGLVLSSVFSEDWENEKIISFKNFEISNRPFSGFILEVFQDELKNSRITRNINDSQMESSIKTNNAFLGASSLQRLFKRNLQAQQSSWDPIQQFWSLSQNVKCLRWGFKEWATLITEILWSLYQCHNKSNLTTELPQNLLLYRRKEN